MKNNMRKGFVVMMMLAVAGCSAMAVSAADSEPLVISEPVVISALVDADDAPLIGMPAPFTKYTDIQEAKKAAGFSIPTPEKLPSGYELDCVLVWNDGSIVELVYRNGEESLCLRLSETLQAEELNGDYNTYEREFTRKVSGISVCCKGSGSKTSVAMWERDGTSRCVMATDPLTRLEVRQLVKGW